MSADRIFHVRLHELLCQLRDAGPSEALVAEIESIVLDDTDAARQYLEFIRLEVAAELLFNDTAEDDLNGVPQPVVHSIRPVADTTGHGDSRWTRLASLGEAMRTSGPLESSQSEHRDSKNSPAAAEDEARSARRFSMHPFTPAICCGVACLFLVGGVLVGMWGGARTSNAAGFDTAVATLVETQDAEWNVTGPGELEAGRRLNLGSLALDVGLAKIVFDCGAQVLLEGPVSVELRGEKSVMLNCGRLVAKVPPAAVGFVVHTPDARVIDHGTEFGLSVDGAGTTEVHVIAGRVDVEPRPTPREQDDAWARAKLLSGDALRWDRGAGHPPQPVELAETRFVREMRFGHGLYPAALISYWTFDEEFEGSRVPDQAGSNHGSYFGQAQRTEGLVGPGAAHFSDTAGDLLNVGPNFTFSTGITIEALIATNWDGTFDLSRPDHRRDTGNYDEIFRKEDNDYRVVFSFQHDHKQSTVKTIPMTPPGPVLSFGLNVGGEYSELDMPLDGRDGRPALEEIADGEMHHVVASYDSATGLKAIYVDGKRCFSTNFSPGTLIQSGGKTSAGIGGFYFAWSNDPTLSGEPFSGVIDEVAIYRAALSDAEVAEHHARVAAGQRYFRANPWLASGDRPRISRR